MVSLPSPLASPLRTSRNLSPARGRGYGSIGQFVPYQLGFLALYDADNGGSATQVTDSSGNSVDPLAFAAAGNSPAWLDYVTDSVFIPGVANNSITTADKAALRVTGDLEVIARLQLNDWTSGATQFVVSKYVAVAGQRAYAFGVSTTGIPTAVLSSNGTTAFVNGPISGASAFSFGDGVTGWVRFTYEAATGTVSAFEAADSTSVPSSWTTRGSVAVGAATLAAGTAALVVGAHSGGGADNLTGRVYRAIVRDGIGGTTVADFDASLCTQTGYTDSLSNIWAVNRSTAGRKTVVQTTVGNQATDAVTFGTDDYANAPVGAIPSMGAADPWSVVLLLRQWDTPTNFGRYLSTKTGSGTGKGISIRTNGTTRQIACHFGDGTNGVDSFGPSAAAVGVRQVIVVSCTGPSVTIYVNGVAGTPVDLSSIGDRATGQMQIGRDSGASSNYQDFLLLKAGTIARALTAGEAASLSTYYGGGVL